MKGFICSFSLHPGGAVRPLQCRALASICISRCPKTGPKICTLRYLKAGSSLAVQLPVQERAMHEGIFETDAFKLMKLYRQAQTAAFPQVVQL